MRAKTKQDSSMASPSHSRVDSLTDSNLPSSPRIHILHADAQPSSVYSPILPPGQVMTEEQLETLRRQISVYSTICKQLVEMHKAMIAQQSSLPGLWFGQTIPLDSSSLHSFGHKLTSRQRWTPSQTQLQILEKLFDLERGTPSKQRIKEITAELSLHGQISETNVYNWFQNRRARMKRKQQLCSPNNGESEIEIECNSPEEKKIKIENYSNDGCVESSQKNGIRWPVNMDERHGMPETCNFEDVNQPSQLGHARVLTAESQEWGMPFPGHESKPGIIEPHKLQGSKAILNGL